MLPEAEPAMLAWDGGYNSVHVMECLEHRPEHYLEIGPLGVWTTGGGGGGGCPPVNKTG